jgi:MSHA biogenesis protein MshK
MMPFVLAAAMLATPIAAADLADPTAPPAPPAADGGAVASPGLSLTAIKRSGNKRVAVIGGQEVAVGGRYQDARVVRISESEVVLRRGREITVLKLYPHVEKRLRGK